MRIALIYFGQQGGGAALDILEMAMGLSHHSELLCIVSSVSTSYGLWKEEENKNSNFHVIGIKTTKSTVKGFLSLFNLIKFISIRKEIEKFGPDVVFSPMPHPWDSLVIPFVKCKIRAKSVHDVKIHKGEDSLKIKIMRKLFSYKADLYVVYSEFSKKALISYDENVKNVLIINLGSNTLIRKSNSLDLNYYGKFLFFGRLIKYKGIDVLMKSLDEVFKIYPESKLVLAGRGDVSEYELFLSKYKKNIELYNKWIADEDIEEYFTGIDFVVAPYTGATQSGVVPTSYSFGKPVIVSDDGGLPEQVKNGETGLVFKTGDSLELAEKIKMLLSNKDLLLKMKKNAYSYSDELSWSNSANKMHEYLTKMLNSK